MNDRENRKFQMFLRVQDFGVAHLSDFAVGSLARQLFAKLSDVIAEIEGHSASEASGVGLARQGTTTRGQAIEALREDLEAINRTALTMANEVPGIEDKFRLPRNRGVQHLLSAARAFLIDATPLKDEFIKRELPANFLEDLQADIDAVEAAISRQASGVGSHVAAGAAIDDAIDRGGETVRNLDAIVKNKYANNPAALAEWTSASHTERNPRHKKSTKESGTSPAQSSSSTERSAVSTEHSASSTGQTPPSNG